MSELPFVHTPTYVTVSQSRVFIVDCVSSEFDLQTYPRYDANQGLIAVHSSQSSVSKYDWPMQRHMSQFHVFIVDCV